MFIKRLFLYLIGFFIGSILVYFMLFKDKSRSFLPSSIILDSLKANEIIYDQHIECILSCYQISNKNIRQMLDDGDVIFSESQPRETPKKYVVEVETAEEKIIKLSFELSGKSSRIFLVNAGENANDCLCE